MKPVNIYIKLLSVFIARQLSSMQFQDVSIAKYNESRTFNKVRLNCYFKARSLSFGGFYSYGFVMFKGR